MKKTLKKQSLQALLILSLLFGGCAAATGDSLSASEDLDSGSVVTADPLFEKAPSSPDPEQAVSVLLADGNSRALGEGVRIENDLITITSAGTYLLQGNLSEGQLIIDAPSDAQVNLILDNLQIISSSGSPIRVSNQSSVNFFLREKSTNSLTNSGSGTDESESAVIYSQGNLSFHGNGSLTLESETSDAIYTSKKLTLNSGILNLSVGGKGLNVSESLLIRGGKLDIQSGDDAVYSKENIDIIGGSLELSTEADAIHADLKLGIADPASVNILQSKEGLESKEIHILGGDIRLSSSDDGINASLADGVSGTPSITISGGNLFVSAEGDGIDSNGDLLVTGGNTVVYGPSSDGDGSLDYDGKALIQGGSFILIGSSGMHQQFSEESGQRSFTLIYSSVQTSKERLSLTDQEGKVLASILPSKPYQALTLSSDEIKPGSSYTLHVGGTLSEDGSKLTGGQASLTWTAQEQDITVDENGNPYSSAGEFPGKNPFPSAPPSFEIPPYRQP